MLDPHTHGHDSWDLVAIGAGDGECWTRYAVQRHRTVLHADRARIGAGMMRSAIRVHARRGMGRRRHEGHAARGTHARTLGRTSARGLRKQQGAEEQEREKIASAQHVVITFPFHSTGGKVTPT